MNNISLEDKYAFDKDRAYLTGIEALVRLPLLQHLRDQEAGLNTAGFISGYRGSPLGTYDVSLNQAKQHLQQRNIVFQPGVNEDLAATSVWGSQQVNLFPGAKYDGVFSLWYGKGPGVDRSMDVIKHANTFGTSKYGGVIAVAGDDHACKSSTIAHQSEHMFIGASVPVLNPANVQEVLDLGIYGWELSRFSGCWVALKAITENMDSAISADIHHQHIHIITPDDFEFPIEGLNARWPSTPLQQERILNRYRIYAARSFARANHLNKIMIDSQHPRLGIITAGKSYLDVLQALEDLGIDQAVIEKIGLRVYKLGMTWPLEPEMTHKFAEGLQEILVVEEKRSIIEDQLTGQLYNYPTSTRPTVVGEFDERGQTLLTNLAELTPAMIAQAIVSRIDKFYTSDVIKSRMAFLQDKEQWLSQPRLKADRTPHFCSGCPHNTSTKVPQGSMALAGIGCHYMATWMDRDTQTFTQMGGEGASWIGQAPFTETPHVFQNLGDGTYFHSGLLAIRAAIASGVNITYKILYNNAVAMTGGQAVDGSLTVEQIIIQLHGEGVQRIAVISDEPTKYPSTFPKFSGLTIHHRDQLDEIQRQLRETSGTTVIIYDQGCAAEKRRKRKKQILIDPPKRVFINSDVCEGCGDCGAVSNCLSVIPKATELGTKRQIDQSACNKDFSCLKGFCPSFVTVSGGDYLPTANIKSNGSNLGHSSLGHSSHENLNREDVIFTALPEPQLPNLDRPWNMLITGIGGTGVLTISSLLTMAAHIEGKGCSTLNQTGLAQKFGSVISHARIGKQQSDINAVRIAAGDSDLLLGCDLVVSAADEALAKLHHQRSTVICNNYQSPTAAFVNNPDQAFPQLAMQQALEQQVGQQQVTFLNVTDIATKLCGDAIASNLFLLGYAYQKGLIPVAAASIEQAIEINNVSIEFNKKAFLWGRRCAFDPAAVEKIVLGDNDNPSASTTAQPLTELDDIINWRVNYLTAYQNAAYAQQYRSFVDQVRHAEIAFQTESEVPLKLTTSVAHYYFKLLAYKDEYEIARLMGHGNFYQRIKQQFKGDVGIHFHLAPPLLAKKDKTTNHLLKQSFPQFTMHLFRLLAKMKGLRGTPF